MSKIKLKNRIEKTTLMTLRHKRKQVELISSMLHMLTSIELILTHQDALASSYHGNGYEYNTYHKNDNALEYISELKKDLQANRDEWTEVLDRWNSRYIEEIRV